MPMLRLYLQHAFIFWIPRISFSSLTIKTSSTNYGHIYLVCGIATVFPQVIVGNYEVG